MALTGRVGALKAELLALVDDLDTIEKTLHVAMRGFHVAQQEPHIGNLLRRVDGREAKENEISGEQQRAEFARNQESKGHPVLHEQAIILTWSALEASVRRLVEVEIHHRPEILDTTPFEKLQVPARIIAIKDSEEANWLLVDALEAKIGSKLGGGYSRLNKLMDVVGWPQPLTKMHCRDLDELYAVRNLLVHRRGRIDRRFKDRCPWRTDKIAQSIRLNHMDYAIYRWAAQCQTHDLINRFKKRQSPDDNEFLDYPSRPELPDAPSDA